MVLPDFIDAGASGPLVMLIHAGGAGARQWRRLMDDLKDRYRLRAVNLFGYGATPPWPSSETQSLADQALLVARAIPEDAETLLMVGHSFGALVAMKLAAQLGARVSKLVLLEPNAFTLLKQSGRLEAFAEVEALRNCVKSHGVVGKWEIAAERFADYWGGAGSWQKMAPERRAAFAEGLKPSFHGWDATMNEATSAQEWARDLPRSTMVVHDPETILAIREIVAILRAACPDWRFETVSCGGHMGPVTRPDLINPIIRSFLDE
jgi:pimeloyl-ACP methyl ester carboxylesterase